MSRVLLLATAALLVGPITFEAHAADSNSALSQEPVPLQVGEARERPQPLELGPPFLGTGLIGEGFTLPGGAVWQPQLLLWGTLRTAVQAFDPRGGSNPESFEWVNRLDAFGQIAVSQTERIVVGLRPFDSGSRFSGCRWQPDERCVDAFDSTIEMLFLEANVGALAPNWAGSGWFDIEIAVGRQPLLFQEGFLIDDTLDAAAISRSNVPIPFTNHTRIAAIGAWRQVHRGNNLRDGRASLAALLIESDVRASTVNLDIAYVHSIRSRGRSFHAGISIVAPVGPFNTAWRALISENFDGNTPEATDGELFFVEINWVPTRTHNNLYLNLFVGIDEYSSAARGPAAGGPLGRTGILFGAVGIGSYGAPLGNSVGDAAGGALGYQMFFANNRRSLTLELGGRDGWSGGQRSAFAAGFRLEQALGRRIVARVDSFLGHREGADLGWGARFEILYKF